ncbi:MAG: Rrf2 family transcriptional regulator [Deltaproteobacteria bacterium]|nr:MAG: Rrf2 family transcriptional regulator [Deltaproteobacteria bacterium]
MAFHVSKASQYAIRAMTHLARQPASEAVLIREIATEEGIPQPFLAKVIRMLGRCGLVETFKGPGGGIRLARPPYRITVREIIECVDGPTLFEGCFLGLSTCSDDAPCPIHENWKVIRERLIGELRSITLADIAAVTSRRARLEGSST